MAAIQTTDAAAVPATAEPTNEASVKSSHPLPVLGPLTTPEAAYAAYLDAEWMISTLAYEIADTRDILETVDKEHQGRETQEVCSRKERLEAELHELQAHYDHFFANLQAAEAARKLLGPTPQEIQEKEEQDALDAEGEYFDVTESCADW
jgi:hypothetical protein